MNFFILGDSWGVGEYENQQGILTPVDNTGIDYWLTKQGHSVKNISQGSASNFGQLRAAYWDLKKNSDYNYIIWFYTEPLRDIIETIMTNSVDCMTQYPDFTIEDFPKCNYITQQNLNYANKIFDEFNIPFIIIGGQCKIPKEIDKFKSIKFKIDNWAAELLEIDRIFPDYTWNSQHKIKSIIDYYKLDEKQFVVDEIQNLNTLEKIEKLSKLSERFPDNCHPGRNEYKLLVDKIIELVNNDK
jgi:hypothetical protein